MAVKKAVASGNWNASATWSPVGVPVAGDTVYSNGFTVTINQVVDLTGSATPVSAGSFVPGQLYRITTIGTYFTGTTNCIIPGSNTGTEASATPAIGDIVQAKTAGASLTGAATPVGGIVNYANAVVSAITGGGFTLPTSFNLTGAYIQSGTTNCLTISAAAAATLTNCTVVGSFASTSTRSIVCSSTGAITFSGASISGGRATGTSVTTGAHGIELTSTGVTSFSGCNIIGGIGAYGLGLLTNALTTASMSNSTIVGGQTGTSYGVYNQSTITLTATTTPLTALQAPAIYNASTGAITSTGNITATNFASALVSPNVSATVRVSGSLLGSVSGVPAAYCAKLLVNPAPTNAKIRFANDGASTYSDFIITSRLPVTTDVRSGTLYGEALTGTLALPAAANVRSGTLYGGITGTCNVPSASSVAAGVPVDATVGIAVLTAAAVTAAVPTTAQITTAVTAAVPTTAQINTAVWTTTGVTRSLTTAPPTAAEIAAAVPTTAQINTAVWTTTGVTRSLTTAPPTAAEITNAVWTTPIRTLTNTIPTAAEITTAVWTTPTRTVTNTIPTTAQINTAVWGTLTGGVARTLTTAPPTAAENAIAVRTNLATELANLDVKVSSRLATGAVALEVTAIKTKTDLLITDRLKEVATTEIVGKLLAQANS